MWATPALVGIFGDAFIENTAFEGSSTLAWSYTVLNYAMQNILGQSIISNEKCGLDKRARIALSDSLNIMNSSVDIFKQMLKMLRTPNETQLLSFLRKFSKEINSMSKGDTRLVPVLVEKRDMLLLLERSSDRVFTMVVIQTSPNGGLVNHSASATLSPPHIYYRTCLVLKNIPRKNAVDDVFWMALFNLAVNPHRGDMRRFYEILLPFILGMPLESALVASEQGAANGDENPQATTCMAAGDWRMAQRSATAYVQCFLEALHYMLRSRGVSPIQSKIVSSAFVLFCFRIFGMFSNFVWVYVRTGPPRPLYGIGKYDEKRFQIRCTGRKWTSCELTGSA